MLYPMLQGGQGLLLHLQGSLTHFSLNQKFPRIHPGEVYSADIENIDLELMEPAT